ncbi:helix-turn-helix domain-containing protein [Streptomyces sp. NPDC060001]|uniref:helix-turn-helix domain-containing protein n=1 Tax=Streptomyces sp. NPDC060001 TaxID=3347032 RepID=UPI0036BDD019
MPRRYTVRGPVTEEERATFQSLHAEGKGRNEIHRITGRSERTITIHCEAMGLTFDRAKTAEATRVRTIDLKARRQAIIEQLYDVTEDDLAYLKGREKYELVEVSSGSAVPYTPKRLPAQDRRALVQSISAALTTAARLEAVDTNNGVDDATSMLGKLASGLSAAYNAMTEEDSSEGAGDAP